MGCKWSSTEQESTLNISQEHNVSQESQTEQQHQRKDSLSSISIESLEDERALLEQCIYSAMPTAQTDEVLLQECIQAGMPKGASEKSDTKVETGKYLLFL